MIPNARLSVETTVSDYLPPDNLTTKALLDYEQGGVAMNDVSMGLQFQTWTLASDGQDVTLSAASGASNKLFSAHDIASARGTTSVPPITEISLAFDKSMQPFVTYVAGGKAGYWWLDSDTQTHYVFIDLPDDINNKRAISPRCCYDDKRPLEAANGDIILGYVQADNLYFRAQRDLFATPYKLMDNAYFTLIKIGMNAKGRLQFMVRERD